MVWRPGPKGGSSRFIAPLAKEPREPKVIWTPSRAVLWLSGRLEFSGTLGSSLSFGARTQCPELQPRPEAASRQSTNQWKRLLIRGPVLKVTRPLAGASENRGISTPSTSTFFNCLRPKALKASLC